MKRKSILSLLFAVALGCTALSFPAMAEELSYIDGSGGMNDKELPRYLIDDNTRTKWCTSDKNPYIIFELPEAKSISSYTIITGNDNSRYPGRNPISWTLYGCNSKEDKDSYEWRVIDSVTNDAVLQNVNYTAYSFPISGTVPAYKYYMFQVDDKNSIVQMSELKLSYDGNSYFSVTSHLIDGTRGINEKEGPKFLFDCDAGTKWCTNASENPYVIFKTPEPVAATGYHIVTANDNSKYTDRNPVSWRFYGCNADQDPDPWFDGWQLLDTVVDDDVLADENYKESHFAFSQKAPACQYYMLWIDEKEGNIIQLSELALSYEGSHFQFSITEPQTSSGNSSGASSGGQNSGGSGTGVPLMCASCHGSGKDHCFTCRGTGFSAGHTCFVCGGAGSKPCIACHGTGYIQ